ncbi:putative motility protein [Clostridium hydrogenum]|uniref:putative motility protein n=1 Tax=Clostridium hydrogenum TaxID=2855764 RepID=UPI001F1D8B37|nr:putative motility protein [Clostridium hydrogenum]
MDVNLAQLSTIKTNENVGTAINVDLIKMQLNGFENNGNNLVNLLDQNTLDIEKAAQPNLGQNINTRV